MPTVTGPKHCRVNPANILSGMTYTATIYADAPDSAENPENYRIEKRTVTSADMLEIAMTARGGQAVTFVPVNE